LSRSRAGTGTSIKKEFTEPETKLTPVTMSRSGNTANRILVIAPSWIGDAVLSHSLLARLTRRAPAPPIDVFAPSWVLPVYRRMPEVADTIENPFRHGQLALGARYQLGRKLARRGYASAYVLPNSLKSALVPWFAGIPSRVGYKGELRFGLLTDRRHLDKQALPLMVERFAWLAQPADTDLGRPLVNPRLRVDAEETVATLERHDLPMQARVACFCPGAEYGSAKRWPTRHFASLAKELADRGFTVWLLGSAADKPVGDEIVHASGGVAKNLCGSTSLDDAIILLSAAELVVTNDSGLMHVAAALDRPTVAVYGSSSPAFTPPLCERARVVKLDLPCSPCFARTCPLKHFDCMQKLGPEKVIETIKAVGVNL
jgi:heptosyltransferase-2